MDAFCNISLWFDEYLVEPWLENEEEEEDEVKVELKDVV